MPISPITNGTIKYGRTVKTGDFESKCADVELSFNVAEGEDPDAVIANVESMTRNHIHSMLGVAEDRVVADPAAVKAKRAARMPRAAASESVEDPASVNEPAAAQNAQAAKANEDDLDDLYGEAPAKEITDKDLNDATQKVQAATKNMSAIRKAINDAGVKSPPGRLIGIAQDKRAAYLAAIATIKPLA